MKGAPSELAALHHPFVVSYAAIGRLGVPAQGTLRGIGAAIRAGRPLEQEEASVQYMVSRALAFADIDAPTRRVVEDTDSNTLLLAVDPIMSKG